MDNNEEQNYSPEPSKVFKVPKKNEEKIGLLKTLLVVFISALVLGLIFISLVLKSASNVDLNIGEDPVASMNQRGDEEYEDNIRMQIDERLKMIQNEEEMPGVSESRNYETDEELIERLRSDGSKKVAVEEEKIKEEKNKDPELQTVSIPAQTAPKPNTISKIYIGQFSDMQKAVDMQSNILNAGLNVNTIIKEVNGYYTIQAGVYSNYESAKAVAEQLSNAGFAAKIVKEIR